MSTHSQCFRAKLRNAAYPCKPQVYYIKVGCKGVLMTRTCSRDDKSNRTAMDRNWSNQKANPALKTKVGNK